MAMRVGFVALALSCALLGCRGTSETDRSEPTPASGGEQSTPSLVQYDDQGRRISRGFAEQGPRRLIPLSEAEQAKLDALEAAERAERNVQVPEQWAGRRSEVEGDTGWAFDLYRDGALLRRIQGTGHEAGTVLSSVLSPDEMAGLRSALAHGTSGARWFGAAELAGLQIRLNRQGRLKLESVAARGRRLPKNRGRAAAGGGAGDGTGDGKGGGAGKGQGGGGGGPKNRVSKRELRDSEIQGLRWIELRSQGSDEVSGELDANPVATPDAP